MNPAHGVGVTYFVQSICMWDFEDCVLGVNRLFFILPGELTENTFSFTATTWGIVTGERNEPIVNW